MKAEELLKIWAESCEETDGCDSCLFAEMCPLMEKMHTAEEIHSFIELAERRYDETNNHFADVSKMAREDHSIGIMLDEGAKMPTRAHDADAGYDLYAKKNTKSVVIGAGCSALFNTGVHMSIPRGYVGFLKSKSGLNVIHGIVSEGVIDSGYTGSIHVKLYNHGLQSYRVRPGDKISQLVILPIITPKLELVDKLDETERGENGFGSSGRC